MQQIPLIQKHHYALSNLSQEKNPNRQSFDWRGKNFNPSSCFLPAAPAMLDSVARPHRYEAFWAGRRVWGGVYEKENTSAETEVFFVRENKRKIIYFCPLAWLCGKG